MLNKRHWDRHKNGGLSFTEIGFGTAPLGNLYKSISDEDAQAEAEPPKAEVALAGLL